MEGEVGGVGGIRFEGSDVVEGVESGGRGVVKEKPD